MSHSDGSKQINRGPYFLLWQNSTNSTSRPTAAATEYNFLATSTGTIWSPWACRIKMGHWTRFMDESVSNFRFWCSHNNLINSQKHGKKQYSLLIGCCCIALRMLLKGACKIRPIWCFLRGPSPAIAFVLIAEPKEWPHKNKVLFIILSKTHWHTKIQSDTRRSSVAVPVESP